MAQVCSRCGKQVGFLGRLTFDKQYERCKECSVTVGSFLVGWRKLFLKACEDGLLTHTEWSELLEVLVQNDISQAEAAAFIRRDALNFVERSFAFAKADGHLDEEEESAIRWLAEELHLEEAASYILSEVEYLSQIRRARQGQLSTIRASAVLPADELCYLETPATYRKAGASKVTEYPGRLLLTNKRIIFTAPSGGGEIPLKAVLNVTAHRVGVFLELSRKKLNGFYVVDQSELAAETILAVIRMATRQMLAPAARDTRRIPQHIKIGVWQRDQGQCVQCHATEYLEFDHIIPFSKGGATSIENLQILCRRCNLAKADSL